MRAFIAALVIAFVAISALSPGRSPLHRMAGIVSDFREGERLLLNSDMTGFSGARFALRANTVYEGDIKRGVTVEVSYRSVGERQLVADKVRVLKPRLRQ